MRLNEAETKASELKISFENLCGMLMFFLATLILGIFTCVQFHVLLFPCPKIESAKAEIDAFEEADRELTLIEEDLRSAEAVKLFSLLISLFLTLLS